MVAVTAVTWNSFGVALQNILCRGLLNPCMYMTISFQMRMSSPNNCLANSALQSLSVTDSSHSCLKEILWVFHSPSVIQTNPLPEQLFILPLYKLSMQMLPLDKMRISAFATSMDDHKISSYCNLMVPPGYDWSEVMIPRRNSKTTMSQKKTMTFKNCRVAYKHVWIN